MVSFLKSAVSICVSVCHAWNTCHVLSNTGLRNAVDLVNVYNTAFKGTTSVSTPERS
jgi:hypothetical protein